VRLWGKTVADELFPNADPIGQQIRICNTPFTVIGVLSSKGQNMMGRDQDDLMLAPTTTVLYRLKGGENMDMIYASCISEDMMSQAEQEVTRIMREAHNIKDGQDDDFTVRNQTEMIEMASEITGVMTMLLGSIAAVSLIVGGIGIINIMLVSVTERTREIGIRLSVGARTSDIMTQFLVEAIKLSCSGGVIGIILSFVIKAILSHTTTVQVLIKPHIILLAFGFAAIIGIFFGFYPARRAVLLNPIDALRHEYELTLPQKVDTDLSTF
jgi:putative ABC transport system permease protein